MDHAKKIITIFAFLILSILIGLLLFDHLQLGLSRFLDIDEYAHLHWSYDASLGQLPYKDFFYIFTPFYLYLIAPVLFITGKTFTYIVGARVVAFGVFCLGAMFLFMIAKISQKSLLFAFLATLIFVYLPLPQDKWIEVRPDGLGVVLALIGTWFTIKAFKEEKNFFWAGFFLSLGAVVNPKIIFYPLSAFVVLLFDRFFFRKNKILIFLEGAALPVILLLVAFFLFGNFSRALYLIFILQKEAGTLWSLRLPMRADLFFYPNDIYYGQMGYNFNYFANCLIYLLATVTSVIRFVSFLADGGREKVLTRLFLTLLFLTNLIAYINFFPLKHIQYLMGVSPFVAYFFADFVVSIVARFKNRGRLGKIAIGFIFVIFVVSLGFYGHKMNIIKASRSFADSKQYLQDAKNNFAEDEYVFDLTGASLFYKDPYYVCCLPYGGYAEVIKFQLPDLASALRTKEVKHIFIQYPERIAALPVEQLRSVQQLYTSTLDLPNSFLTLGAEVNFGKEQEAKFELIANGWYKIYLDDKFVPAEQLTKLVLLEGKIILSNPIYLGRGKYIMRRLDKINNLKVVYAKK